MKLEMWSNRLWSRRSRQLGIEAGCCNYLLLLLSFRKRLNSCILIFIADIKICPAASWCVKYSKYASSDVNILLQFYLWVVSALILLVCKLVQWYCFCCNLYFCFFVSKWQKIKDNDFSLCAERCEQLTLRMVEVTQICWLSWLQLKRRLLLRWTDNRLTLIQQVFLVSVCVFKPTGWSGINECHVTMRDSDLTHLFYSPSDW